MRSIIDIKPPQSAMMSIEDVAKGVEGLRQAAAQRRAIQQQTELSKFKLQHPLYGQPGVAGQVGAAGLMPEGSQERQSIMGALDQALKSQVANIHYKNIIAGMQGKRYQSPEGREQSELSAKKHGLTQAQYANLNTEQLAALEDPNVSEEEKRQLGIPSPVNPELARKQYEQQEAQRSARYLTSKQKEQKLLLPAAQTGIEHLRNLSKQFPGYFGGIGAIKRGVGAIEAFSGIDNPEYQAYSKFNKILGSVTSKIRGALQGQATDYETKLIGSLIGGGLLHMTPKMMEQTLDQAQEMLSTQQKLINEYRRRGIVPDYHELAKQRANLQNSSYTPSAPRFNNEKEKSEWLDNLAKNHPQELLKLYQGKG
jgi:hypothetical protein